MLERTQPERFLGAPVTITVVFSLAKLAKAIVASGSVVDEASTRKNVTKMSSSYALVV